MANKTLRVFAAPSADNVAIGPQINMGDVDFDLKSSLIKMAQASPFCGILIRLATEWASLRHRDEAGLQVEVHVSHVDLRPNGHIISRGSSELAESLVSHSLEDRWRWYGWFLCR